MLLSVDQTTFQVLTVLVEHAEHSARCVGHQANMQLALGSHQDLCLLLVAAGSIMVI